MSIAGPYTSKEAMSLASGTQFWGKFIIADKNQRKTRNGRELINLRLADSTGSLEVVVWDNCQVQGDLQKGAVVGMQGDASLYNNRQQITARRIKVLTEEDPTAYLQTTAIPREVLVGELQQMVQSIADPHIALLLQTILTPECITKFSYTPAAKRIHHNYTGGLLEHTVQVARLCQAAAQMYPGLNRDLLLAGAILHDIGKMEEYEMQVMPEYTVEGKLLGHIVIGYQRLDQAISKLRQSGAVFPEMLENMIKHLILSHHGSLEFGSPVKPLFPEAFILHVMDNLDAKMFVFFEKITQNNLQEYLTPYDTFHQQQFFTYRYEGSDYTAPTGGAG
jgi:3'-5' exoribonuclease